MSDDGRWLAYLVDDTGFRQYVLHVRDLKTGKDGVEAIPRVTSVAWATDYADAALRDRGRDHEAPDTVFRHQIGDTGPDPVVLEEKDERFNAARRADPERGVPARPVVEPHHHRRSGSSGAQPDERVDGDRPPESGPGVRRGPPGQPLLRPGERPRTQLSPGLGAGELSGTRALEGGDAGTAQGRPRVGGRVRRPSRDLLERQGGLQTLRILDLDHGGKATGGRASPTRPTRSSTITTRTSNRPYYRFIYQSTGATQDGHRRGSALGRRRRSTSGRRSRAASTPRTTGVSISTPRRPTGRRFRSPSSTASLRSRRSSGRCGSPDMARTDIRSTPGSTRTGYRCSIGAS